MLPFPDTIYALSSGRLPAAIAVVRISGPHAGDALCALTGRIPEPRRAALARVRDPGSGEIIDEALALWFPGPKSETGEDVAELQLHGGRAVLAATFEALGQIEGLRPAEVGEFTRRAFANGQLDLTAVEGLADLIGAETEAQRRQAFRQMKGLLGDRAEDWRKRLIEASALLEAGIDFADEDVPDSLMPQVRAKVRALADEIGAALDDGRRGERVRDGLVVAIAGPPNAGKSTLLNRIAQRDVAIVSPHAGTTRDVIEVHLDLGGYPVTLLDTAGIRETDDPVELEGVNRARARAAAADLVLWVVDATDPSPPLPPEDISDVLPIGASFPGTLGLMDRAAGSDRSGVPPSGSVAAALSPESRISSALPTTDSSSVPLPDGRVIRAAATSSTTGPVCSDIADATPQSFDSLAATPQRGDTPIALSLSRDVHSGPAPSIGRVRMRSSSLDDSVSPEFAGSETQSVRGGTASARGEERPAEAATFDAPVAIPSLSGGTSIATVTSSPKNGISAWLVRNKVDLTYKEVDSALRSGQRRNESKTQYYAIEYDISATEGVGIDLLLKHLSAFAGEAIAESALITRARHREILIATKNSLIRALDVPQDDLMAEEMRLAARSLGRLTGRIDVEDILDVIFRDFCIGK